MNAGRRWRIIRILLSSVALFIVWLLFTARLETFTLLAGIAGSFLVATLTCDVFIPRHQASLRFTVPRLFWLVLYFPVLTFLLIQSSIRMTNAVITGNAQPRIVHFHTSLRSDLARTVLANSITFTPGTITLDLNDDHLTVHWFFCTTSHSRAAGEHIKGSMEKLLGRIWR